MSKVNEIKMEKFSIPAVAGIIEKTIEGKKYILIQQRVKEDCPGERGLFEIPAGKIREFENIFECLKREVFEETGLRVTKIEGKENIDIETIEQNNYKVITFEPFFTSQNISGNYPIMVLTFICRAEGIIAEKTNEAENINWISLDDLSKKLIEEQNSFYPMHIASLKKYLKEEL